MKLVINYENRYMKEKKPYIAVLMFKNYRLTVICNRLKKRDFNS